MKGDLYGLQSYDTKETIVLSPYNNTEYLNVAAYLEAFWGYIWPAVCSQQRATARRMDQQLPWRIEGVH